MMSIKNLCIGALVLIMGGCAPTHCDCLICEAARNVVYLSEHAPYMEIVDEYGDTIVTPYVTPEARMWNDSLVSLLSDEVRRDPIMAARDFNNNKLLVRMCEEGYDFLSQLDVSVEDSEKFENHLKKFDYGK